ncbi:MAG: ATP phosphoribosyltransferase [Gemmatimonadetes bacterium]|nr:ATP phosphoribosyltransferase [Gemmatimonadota bacterium]
MLRIAIPNKGRLANQTLTLFEKAGLKADSRVDRALVANLGSEFRAIFVRAQDISEFVADGAADLGVTGADLVAESGQSVEELLDLEYGKCRLAVAVREESTITEARLMEAGTRVATSFPRVTKSFFDKLGVSVKVAPVSGAAEIAPHLGVADVIVDLVSTGSTLKVNGLKELDTILTSSAWLIANRAAVADPESGEKISELVTALESVIRARSKRYLMANVPRDRLPEVKQVIPGLSGPTIVEIQNGNGWVAAHAVVEADKIYQTIIRLKALGAEGILVTPIERLMP